MIFNSYNFILAFLPIFVILYFLFGRFGKSFSKWVVIIGSAVFYSFGGLESAVVLCVSIVFNFLLSVWISKTPDQRRKKICLVLTVILNVGLLLFYKYAGFITGQAGLPDEAVSEKNKWILPLGISFFTFQQIMYAVSVWKAEIKEVIITDYLAYILYFPKITMGPLIEPVEFLKQLNADDNKTINSDSIASGLKLFSIGLFKKMVLADTFAKAVNWGFASELSKLTSGDLFLVMLFYTFQIYFDFSGYSDMAVGVSKMINISLPMNFDSPYKADSIRSFWQRWHISLTNFLTKYIYFPLGGSRKGAFRTCVNIMIVFLVSGIWHGANWTFILWGVIHGLLQVMERTFKNIFGNLIEAVRWGLTFFAVNILWLLFRAESIGQWWNMLTVMFRFQNMAVSKGLIDKFVLPENKFIFDKLFLNQLNKNVRGFSMIIFIAAAFIFCLVPESAYRRMDKLNWVNAVLCAAAFLWGFLCLSTESVFIYSNF